MKAPILLFTGFFLLSVSILSPVLPEVSIAQAQSPATIQEANEEHEAPMRPRKRDISITQRALAAMNLRKTQREKNLKKSAPLLPIVDQEDILLRHRILANEVLRSLPQGCVSQLKTFYVRYDNPSRRGLAGKTTIILSGKVADDEFKALLIHEFGHITDLGCMQGKDSHRPSSFKDGAEVIYMDDPSVSFYSISWLDSETKRQGAKDEDFVSGYSSWDPFEDFAESFAYFLLQKDAFKERSRTNPVIAAKYRWMQQNVFDTVSDVATGEHEWTGEVPWDVTKLAYQWR
ncbi:hypothetical protein KKF55_04305 [Patescibacteria group bacterium]|nr:hypothetical protein [Patescibacteria group bacterium]